ncbi:MAG TPA: hypothetical protein VE544_07985 [Nitrososphaeraceae archaeon]|nr:hypothetical protein [Nitrososphaeraceae archaeon]
MTEADPFPPSSHHPQFATANIYKCLAPCKECTGYYTSELLRKRLICYCRCHSIAENGSPFTTPRFREAGC